MKTYHHPHRELVKAIPREKLVSTTGLKTQSISNWCAQGVPPEWRPLVARFLFEMGRADLIPFNFLNDRTPDEIREHAERNNVTQMRGTA